MVTRSEIEGGGGRIGAGDGVDAWLGMRCGMSTLVT